MADVLDYIFLGTEPNDGTGDNPREGGQKINNFIRRGRGDVRKISTNITLTAIDANDFIVCENESPITITILEGAEVGSGSDYIYLKNSLCTIVRTNGLVTIVVGEEQDVTLVGHTVIETINSWIRLRYLGENVWNIDNNSLNNEMPISRTLTDSANFAAGDIGKTVIMNKATDVTLTIPKNLLSAGQTIGVFTIGAGEVTIAVATSDDQSLNDANKTPGQDTMIAVYCIDDTTNDEVHKVIGGVE